MRFGKGNETDVMSIRCDVNEEVKSEGCVVIGWLQHGGCGSRGEL